MKHQYFGDVNDYVKYGVLRCLINADLRVGVCWMLTADDHRVDGRKVEYLSRPHAWQGHDAELFDYLARTVGAPSGRQLRQIEVCGALPRTQFFGDPVPVARTDRTIWFAHALSELAGCDVLFFDPDNGIEVPSCPPGTIQSSKYVYWQELRDAWVHGASLLVFQHFPRRERTSYTTIMADRLKSQLTDADVTSIASANVLFLLAGQPKHRARLEAALMAIRKSWSPRVAVTPVDVPRPEALTSG